MRLKGDVSIQDEYAERAAVFILDLRNELIDACEKATGGENNGAGSGFNQADFDMYWEDATGDEDTVKAQMEQAIEAHCREHGYPVPVFDKDIHVRVMVDDDEE